MNLNGVAGDMCFCHQFKNTMHTYNTIQLPTFNIWYRLGADLI